MIQITHPLIKNQFLPAFVLPEDGIDMDGLLESLGHELEDQAIKRTAAERSRVVTEPSRSRWRLSPAHVE